MLKKFFIIILMLCLSGSAFCFDHSQISPPVEIRGIWLDAGAIPKTEPEIRKLIKSYSDANLNIIFPEVIARGYTVYKSGILSRDPRFAGAIDPLPIIIDESHKLGMEVHPWVWTFRAGYSKDKGAILTSHPEWAELSKDGKDLSPLGGYWLSPGIPEARNFLLKLFSELVTNYNVDGIHLDYVRYEPESPVQYGYSNLSRGLFKKQYGVDPVDIEYLTMNQLYWNAFRERQINTFVKAVSFEMRKAKPNIKVSAAVAPDPKSARLQYMQNWPNWAANKWVDFLTPMVYSTDDNYFKSMTTQAVNAVNDSALIAPGIGFFAHKDPLQMISQIGIARTHQTAGQALFASSYLKDVQLNNLQQGPYNTPASLPFRCPDTKSKELMVYANYLKNRNELEAADYYSKFSDALSKYAKYQESQIVYVPPSSPPLNIPETIIPLPSVTIPKAASQVNIDGQLTEAAWKSASQVQLCYTNTGNPAPVQTTAYLMHDERNLYIGFVSAEPNTGNIKAETDKRDGPVFYDDSVEIFITPEPGSQTYYQFSTNTLGAMFDQKVYDSKWDANWQAMSKIISSSWSSEIAIPLDSFGASSLKAKWGLNLTRNRTAGGGDGIEHLCWAVPYGSFHTPQRFGTAMFD